MTVDRQFDVRVRFEADCEAVAYHIQPTGTPAWLTEYFMHWAHPLGTEWSVAQLQPTRAELKAELTRIYKAANALGEALDDPITRAFLELQHNFIFQEKFADLGGLLRTMRNYAYQSAMSPALSDSTGKTKRGRGNAPVPEADNPKVFCALVVAEAWKFVYGEYPSPKSEPAAKAALAFWSVSGGKEPQGWGAKRERAWRPYFEKARTPVHVSKRAECLRILCGLKSHADSLGI